MVTPVTTKPFDGTLTQNTLIGRMAAKSNRCDQMQEFHRRRLLLAAAAAATLLAAGCGTTRTARRDPVVDRLMAHYRQWFGTPYQWGGNSRRGVDCSAFVQATYQSVFQRSLPRNTEEQADVGRRVSRKNLRSGDLVFFKTGWFKYHVGVYVADGKFIHASESKGVIQSSLSNDYWSRRYWKARRVV